MNDLQQLQTECKGLNDKIFEIEKKYPGGLVVDDADFKVLEESTRELEAKSTELQALAAKYAALRNAGDLARRTSALTADVALPGNRAETEAHEEAQYKSLGQLFTESPDFQQRLAAGHYNSATGGDAFTLEFQGKSLFADHMEQKAAGALIHTARTGFDASSQSPFPSLVRRPGFTPLLYYPRTITDLFQHSPITEEILEYVEEKTFNNNAAMIDEASAIDGTTGTKPLSDFDFQVKQQVVHDLAHAMVVTNKMLRQSNLRSLIDERLELGLDELVEGQLLTGDGTGNNLPGLLGYAWGIQSRAKGSDSIVDAIHKAITAVRVTGKDTVNMIVMHDEDWETVRLSRENAATGTLGGYLYGPPSQAGQEVMWGIPVTRTPRVTKGTAIVGNSLQAHVYDRERTGVQVGTVDAQFRRNMRTILAEMALMFVVFRPTSFCAVSGL